MNPAIKLNQNSALKTKTWPLRPRYAYFVFIIIFLISSCKKFVDISLPVNQVTASNVFSSDATATAAVVGIYSRMMNSGLYFFNGGLTLYPACSADEILRTSPDENTDPFYYNAIPSTSSVVQNDLWRTAYQVIYQSNDCLEGLLNSTGVTEQVKQQLMGEVKFVRAFTYFYLINLFGDVPLELTTDYRQNASAERTSAQQVYQQVINDLKDAETLLNGQYVTNEPLRPCKWTAAAMLARVYLYTENWSGAQAESSKVINSGAYSLVKDLTAVFLADSPEAIWQLYPVLPGRNTAEAQIFIPAANHKPTYALTAFLLNSFEDADKRKLYWIDSTVINNKTYCFPYKYKVKTGTAKTEYNMVLRFAEQFLIRAGARAEQNNVSDAIDDINKIRNRAGLNALPKTLTKTECLAAINQERRHEFFSEWGHRWFDLKRTAQADSVLGSEKPNWNSTDVLYPIPFNEIELNQNLTQNPGY